MSVTPPKELPLWDGKTPYKSLRPRFEIRDGVDLVAVRRSYAAAVRVIERSHLSHPVLRECWETHP